jgi:pyridoxal phosphate enzyme (YggS family)
MMNISGNIKKIKSELPQHVKLIAVSKTKTVEEIMQAYISGHRIFGENKVQEILKKHELMPKDIDWHFIGHLQRNKVKQIIPFISLIHSVDSFRLLEKINEEAKRIGIKVNCLFQIHIAEEETKFGFSEEELVQLLPSNEYKSLQNIIICGLMGMASYTENSDQIKKEFSIIRTLFDVLKRNYLFNNKDFKELSIGMSGDYQIAVQQGSTMVRIGSSIFGDRNY